MNTSFFNIRNTNQPATLAERIWHQKAMKAIAEKNAKKVIITFPDGSEKEFDSGMQASRFLGGSSGLVSGWIKNKTTPRGKFKGYSARLKD